MLTAWICALIVAIVLAMVWGILEVLFEIGRPTAWFLRKIPLDFIQQHVNPTKWISAEIKTIKEIPPTFDEYGSTSEVQKTYNNMTINLVSKLPFKIDFVSLAGELIVNEHETNATLPNKNGIILQKKSNNNEIKWSILGGVDSNIFIVRNGQKDWGIEDKFKVKFTGIDDKGRKYNFYGMEN
jgi:hypothetical protein